MTWTYTIPDGKSALIVTWDRGGDDEKELIFDWRELMQSIRDDRDSLEDCTVGSAAYIGIVAGPAIDWLESRVLEIARER